MLNAGLSSPLTAPKLPSGLGRRDQYVQLSPEREIPNEFRLGEDRYTFRQTQSLRPDRGMRSAAGIRLMARQWPEAADVRAAQRLRSGVSPFAGEARRKTWLSDALAELAGCPEAAVEEGLDGPSEIGLEKADAVLRGVSGFVEEQPDVYPMEAGGIVIDLRSPDVPGSVLMVVERDGAGVLFYRASGKKGRARVDDAAGLPDLLKALGLSPVKATENR